MRNFAFSKISLGRIFHGFSSKNKPIFLFMLVILTVVFAGCPNVFTNPTYNPPQTATGSIEGRVVFSNSDNHEGIVISLDDSGSLRTVAPELVATGEVSSKAVVASVVSDVDGDYLIEDLEPGTYTLYASSPDSLEKTVYLNVTVAAEGVTRAPDLDLTAVGHLSGTITGVGLENGNLGFMIFVAETSSMAMTGTSGDFLISNVPAGNDYLVVIIKGDYLGIWDVIDIEAGETKDLGEKSLTLEEISDPANSIIWKGSLTSAPADPRTNWAYYNSTDGVSYIYDGTEWQILAQDGQDGADGEDGADGQDGSVGVAISWQGTLTTHPANPQLNWAYYNSTDGVSYIYDGTEWQVLAQDGLDGTDGSDGSDGAAGTDGISVNWLGTFTNTSVPSSPATNDAYYNSDDGVSYIWDGDSWEILAQDGADGEDGQDGQDGADAVPISWRGELATAPADPQLNWAYYNSTDGVSYIYDGTTWQILAQDGLDGTDGSDGAAGADGISVNWLGTLTSAPTIPQTNDAYYNSTDGISYIYDGESWQILAQDGQDGADAVPISWRGELATPPADPQLNWAYYNSTDGVSYIYDGTTWQILAQDGLDGIDGSDGAAGVDGIDGISVNWLGTLTSAPTTPQTNDAYYNSDDGISYIWDGDSWEILAQDGSDGQDLEIVTIFTISEVTAPVTGESPVTTGIETDQYTVTISWTPDNDPYLASTVYTANIVLVAKQGWTFSGVPEDAFSLSGATSVSNDANTGYVTAVFPATDPEP